MAELYSDTWSEVAANNNANSPDGWPGSTTFPNIPGIGREMMAGIKREWNLSHPTLTTGGDGDLITLTPGTAITEYKHGQIFAAKLNADLGAAGAARPTLNVSSKGAKKIYLATYTGGHDQLRVDGGEAKSGQAVFFRYDSSLDSGSGGFVIFSYLPLGRRLERIEFSLTAENGTVPSLSVDALIFRLPYAFEMTDAKASVKTNSGATIQVYPLLGRFSGGTHLTNSPYIQIDANETTSEDSAYPVSMTATAASLSSGSEISLNIVCSGGTATGLKVTLLGYQL
jgi:hypothetical protein